MSVRDFALPAHRLAWAKLLLAPLDDARFDALARELFAWQFSRVLPFRRLCQAHGVTPRTLTNFRDIPAMPQQVFKREKLFAHGARRPGAIYETSGTTTGRPGRQHLLAPDLYKFVALAGAQRAGLLDGRAELHFLTPSPQAAPHSSLSAMFGFWRGTFWVKHDGFDFTGLRERLTAAILDDQPIGLAGAAFAFVHLLEDWDSYAPLRLPRGSWVLETGGFKGRSREIPKAELYGNIARVLGVPDRAIWNEYGMSELSSQAYARGPHGRHAVPPWARVLVVDPKTNREVRVGQRGLVRWIDLANVDSVLAVQTLDLAERTAGGFRLSGRLPRTEARGCSLSADDLMPAEDRP